MEHPAQTITLTGFIVQDKDTKEYNFSPCEASYDWQITVCPTVIVHHFIIPPDFNPVTSEITKLEGQLTKAADAYYSMKEKLEGKIADLKCLSYEAESPPLTAYGNPSPIFVASQADDIPF